MYTITQKLDGTFLCCVRMQDDTERFVEPTREKAIQSVIQSARVLNHSYIREDDIEFFQETHSPTLLSAEDKQLLDDIKRGAKVVLDFDHYLLKYRITEFEAEQLVRIREGDLRVV